MNDMSHRITHPADPVLPEAFSRAAVALRDYVHALPDLTPALWEEMNGLMGAVAQEAHERLCAATTIEEQQAMLLHIIRGTFDSMQLGGLHPRSYDLVMRWMGLTKGIYATMAPYAHANNPCLKAVENYISVTSMANEAIASLLRPKLLAMGVEPDREKLTFIGTAREQEYHYYESKRGQPFSRTDEEKIQRRMQHYLGEMFAPYKDILPRADIVPEALGLIAMGAQKQAQGYQRAPLPHANDSEHDIWGGKPWDALLHDPENQAQIARHVAPVFARFDQLVEPHELASARAMLEQRLNLGGPAAQRT